MTIADQSQFLGRNPNETRGPRQQMLRRQSGVFAQGGLRRLEMMRIEGIILGIALSCLTQPNKMTILMQVLKANGFVWSELGVTTKIPALEVSPATDLKLRSGSSEFRHIMVHSAVRGVFKSRGDGAHGAPAGSRGASPLWRAVEFDYRLDRSASSVNG
jgi:hypothetical protein